MFVKKYGLLILSILCLVLIGARWVSAAQSPAIIRRVFASGGGHLEQGIYSLNNTIGQPVVARQSRNNKSLCAGFWCREIRFYFAYLPLLLRNYP
jgi:hypothetical protein